MSKFDEFEGAIEAWSAVPGSRQRFIAVILWYMKNCSREDKDSLRYVELVRRGAQILLRNFGEKFFSSCHVIFKLLISRFEAEESGQQWNLSEDMFPLIDLFRIFAEEASQDVSIRSMLISSLASFLKFLLEESTSLCPPTENAPHERLPHALYVLAAFAAITKLKLLSE